MIIHLYLILATALGGAIGAALRYGVGILSLMFLGAGFPWATLIVNIVGSFVMGVLVEIFGTVYNPGKTMQVFLTTGILGGFTTFSTFSLDAVTLYERGNMAVTGGYIAASVILSIAGVFAGMAAVRTFFG